VTKALSLEYGVGGICVLLTLNVLVKVAQVFLEQHNKKTRVTERTIKELVEAVKKLEFRMVELNVSFDQLSKLKLDVLRSFTALKSLAGDRWPSIREDIMKDREWSSS